MSVVNHRCAVLGKPIAHSLSPVLHNAAYRALGLDDWTYDRHEVGQDDLDGFLHGLDPSWVGLSLTMPLKKTIQPYGVPTSFWAMQLGVANTAVFDWSDMEHGRDGLPAIRLYNTDVMGIVLAIDHALDRPSSTDIDALLDADSSGPASRRAGDDRPARAVILGNGKKIKCPEEWVKAHEAFYKAEIEADKAAMSKIQSESEVTKDEAAASRLQQAEAKLKADEAALENAHEIIFGIRPEDIHEGDEEHVKRYGGEPYDISVAVAELLGHEYYVHSDFAGGDLVAKIPLTHEIKIGDQMKILFDVPKAHIFDKATEKRIY